MAKATATANGTAELDAELVPAQTGAPLPGAHVMGASASLSVRYRVFSREAAFIHEPVTLPDGRIATVDGNGIAVQLVPADTDEHGTIRVVFHGGALTSHDPFEVDSVVVVSFKAEG